MSFVKIGGAALNQTPLDWENNSGNIREAIIKARQDNVRILCLPELCITGYGCEDLFLTEWLPEKALQELEKIIPLCQNITVSIGLPIRIHGKLYNSACLVKDGKVLGISAKQFLANDGVHYEPRWFTPWQAGEVIRFTADTFECDFGDLMYEAEGIKIAFEICEDAWRPDAERPALRYCRKNVELILNPSASHFAFGKSTFRYDLIIGSSEKFNCVYLYANLLGNEAGRMIYDGEVLIASKGKLIQRNDRLSFNDIDLVSANINLKTGEAKEEKLRDDKREKEFEFWEAAALGLYDYLRKSRNKGFVLSLSGGADSSFCAVMVSEMVKKGIAELGMRNFIEKANLPVTFADVEKLSSGEQHKFIVSQIFVCAYQASKNSGTDTLESAKKLAESIGAVFYEWSIEEEVKSYSEKIEKAIGRRLTWETDDITLQNIQARARSPIIWMLANIRRSILLTTSNRSEGDVGYTTMDGDTSGSLAPIAGVDKHFIRSWLLWAEKNLDQPGLKYVNSLIPTAELRPPEKSQTDEKDLMPYEILAEIERHAIRDRKSPLQVYRSMKEEKDTDPALLKSYISRFFRMWSASQWKRERLAPSFHLDDFNIDPRSWCRFPILSGGFKEELEALERE